MTKRIACAAVLVSAAVALTGLIPVQSHADETADRTATDFYRKPAGLPEHQPGTLIRTQEFTPGMDQVFGISSANTTTRRIMYVSTDSHDQPTAVTGTVFVPHAAWTGLGERPLVSVAAGAHGQGDQCLQSKSFEHPIQAHPPMDMSIGYELPSIRALLDRGFAVAVTDYMQVGPVQTYLNRVEQGRSVIDIARAARHLTGIPTTGPIAFWGYSQGGGAAAAAAELQPTYARELDLRAVYAGAVPADIPRVLQQATSGAATGVVAWTINSALASEPRLRPSVNAVLSAEGIHLLQTAATECLVAGIVRASIPATAYTRSGRPLLDELLTIPAIAGWLHQQNLGTIAPTVPVLLHSARNDDLVPYQVQTHLAEAWRARGADVTLRTFESPPVLPGMLIGHSLPHQLDNAEAVTWLADRMRGTPH